MRFLSADLNSRNLYTYEEDKKLAEYIAKRIPDEKAGGRFGVNIYKELCDPVSPRLITYLTPCLFYVS